MGDRSDRKTEQLDVHQPFMSEPPTAITDVADLRRVLGGDVWEGFDAIENGLFGDDGG